MTNLPMSAHERSESVTTVFGFWMYLMSDFLLFAALFAVYAVMRHNTFGGPGEKELFDLPLALVETIVLLTSSFTCGLALLEARRLNKQHMLTWLSVTAILGIVFVTLELREFMHFYAIGSQAQASGFLSAYFTLVGTHGLHVSLGLVWLAALGVAFFRRGFTNANLKKLLLWSLFWHFLDIVWIFIFSIVYLTGSL